MDKFLVSSRALIDEIFVDLCWRCYNRCKTLSFNLLEGPIMDGIVVDFF